MKKIVLILFMFQIIITSAMPKSTAPQDLTLGYNRHGIILKTPSNWIIVQENITQGNNTNLAQIMEEPTNNDWTKPNINIIKSNNTRDDSPRELAEMFVSQEKSSFSNYESSITDNIVFSRIKGVVRNTSFTHNNITFSTIQYILKTEENIIYSVTGTFIDDSLGENKATIKKILKSLVITSNEPK